MKHKIIVAGIGPGNAEYMLPKALQAIEQANFLVGGKRALAQFAHEGQITMPIAADIPAVLAFIREHLAEADVVVMVSGDPGYYSLLDRLRSEFSVEQITVLPGISSMQMAFAKLALPWHDADLLSFHGRVPEEGKLHYAENRLIGFLTDGIHNSHTVPQKLLELGWPKDTYFAVCSRLSYEDEVIIQTTLAEAEKYPVYTHCILVVRA